MAKLCSLLCWHKARTLLPHVTVLKGRAGSVPFFFPFVCMLWCAHAHHSVVSCLCTSWPFSATCGKVASHHNQTSSCSEPGRDLRDLILNMESSLIANGACSCCSTLCSNSLCLSLPYAAQGQVGVSEPIVQMVHFDLRQAESFRWGAACKLVAGCGTSVCWKHCSAKAQSLPSSAVYLAAVTRSPMQNQDLLFWVQDLLF